MFGVFQFEVAKFFFSFGKFKYPEHPLPYFLLGLSDWWKIVPNPEDASHDAQCFANMDSCIVLAEKIYDLDDERKVEASFLLAAAYAFKGRIHAERKHWAKATFTGKSALKYFKKSKGESDLSPELVFGDGLYNYYAEWIPANYGALKPIFWFFPNGDKALAIKQLEKVSFNAFYTRTEARYFLLQIYGMENQNDKAYDLAKYTYQNYPDNPFFHRYYARCSFVVGKLKEAEAESKIILDRIAAGQTGYEGVSGRYAAYILAYYAQNYYHDIPKAKDYYQKTLNFAKQSGTTKSGYYWSSLLALGKMATQENKLDEAGDYYKQCLDEADKSATQHDEAKKLLAENKKARRKAKK